MLLLLSKIFDSQWCLSDPIDFQSNFCWLWCCFAQFRLRLRETLRFYIVQQHGIGFRYLENLNKIYGIIRMWISKISFGYIFLRNFFIINGFDFVLLGCCVLLMAIKISFSLFQAFIRSNLDLFGFSLSNAFFCLVQICFCFCSNTMATVI